MLPKTYLRLISQKQQKSLTDILGSKSIYVKHIEFICK